MKSEGSEGNEFTKKTKKEKKSKKKKKSKKEKKQPDSDAHPKVASVSLPVENKKDTFSDNSTPLSVSEAKDQSKPTNEITSVPKPGSHPFEVDDSDHCETPFKAYQDLTVVLDRLLVKSPGGGKKPRSSLCIYDPYYCDGGVKTKLASLGFTNVINENRDFYEDIAKGNIPDYDVLVTNPPYSGVHMEKLLDFCVSMESDKKPSFLLFPHFVYTKDYFSRATSPLPVPSLFFSFLVPPIRYSYVPPAWVVNRQRASKALARGKDTTAPFPSFWYCCHIEKTTANHQWLEDTFGTSGSVRSKHSSSGLRYARMPRDIPRDFKGEFDPNRKRPNPKARKRLRKAAMSQAQPKQQQPQQQRSRDPNKKKKRRY